MTPEIDNTFDHFVYLWKSVQANYIAGELNIDVLDTPQLVDTFHLGKSDLQKQLARIVKSSEEPKYSLFKNSFKSINALEFYLYKDDNISDTEKDYALFTLTALKNHFTDIETAYATKAEKLAKNTDKTMSYFLNSLIESSYKLKEWRVGEPAGTSKKYKGNPDNNRQEYPLSYKSITAIAAILDTHNKLIGEQKYTNLGSQAIAQGAIKEVTQIREILNKAIKQTQALQESKNYNLTTQEVKDLYNTINELNKSYYYSLINALPVQAKIFLLQVLLQLIVLPKGLIRRLYL